MNNSVGFAIVGWNNKNILKDCFNSIQEQTYQKHQTIYWDNDSHDGSAEYVEANYKWVRVVRSKKNLGFAAANNRVIELFMQDKDISHVVLLNTDACLDREWLANIINTAIKKPRAAFFQGKTLDYYNHEVIDSTHIYVAKSGQATQGSWRNLDSGVDYPKRVFGVNAAACLVTRNYIISQPFRNLFDEKFFMYLEDVDVAVRALTAGWDAYYVPTSIAYHMGSVSSGKNPGLSLYLTYRNNLAMLLKNYPLPLLLKIFPKMIKSDFYTIKGLLKDKKPGSMKIIKGRLVGFFRLPIYFRSALIIKRHKKIDNDYLWQMMTRGF